MNEYELTVLIHPDLEANLDSALDKVRGLITTNGGELPKKKTGARKNWPTQSSVKTLQFTFALRLNCQHQLY